MEEQQSNSNQEETKECPRCKETLPLSRFKDSKFDKVKNKIRKWNRKICKKCTNAASRDRNRERNAANREAGLADIQAKLCPTCKQLKDRSEFPLHLSSSDGLYYCCKTCNSTNKKKIKNLNVANMEAGLANTKPKVCSTCKQLKDRSEFGLDAYSGDGLHRCCKNCNKKVSWFSKLRKCSVTEDDWQRYCATTHCECCGVEFTGNGYSKKNQDHDHNKNVLRGVICNQCNTLEGRMRSTVKRFAIKGDGSEVDPRILQCVKDYIQKWDTQILGETNKPHQIHPQIRPSNINLNKITP